MSLGVNHPVRPLRSRGRLFRTVRLLVLLKSFPEKVFQRSLPRLAESRRAIISPRLQTFEAACDLSTGESRVNQVR